MTNDELLEKALTYIREHADTYAKAFALMKHLKEFRKSKKAILMQVAEKAGFTTASAQEREAYASDDYVELLEALQIATEDAYREQYMIKAAELKVDVWRSKEASARSEKNRYGA